MAYEGRGVMGNVKTFMYDSVKAMFPEVTIETSDAWLGGNIGTIMPKMLQKGYKIETKDVRHKLQYPYASITRLLSYKF